VRSVAAEGRSAGTSVYFPAVNAEFNWWLLIVGIVVGAGLVWFVLADSRRRERDIDAEELPREALWLSTSLADEGWSVPPEATERLLRLHRQYLEAPPPDAVPAETNPLLDDDSGDEPSELAADDRGRARSGATDLGQ
jgi:hypothetical protein